MWNNCRNARTFASRSKLVSLETVSCWWLLPRSRMTLTLCAPNIKIVEWIIGNDWNVRYARSCPWNYSVWYWIRLKQFRFNWKRINSRRQDKKRNSLLLRRIARTHTRSQEVMFQVSGRERESAWKNVRSIMCNFVKRGSSRKLSVLIRRVSHSFFKYHPKDIRVSDEEATIRRTHTPLSLLIIFVLTRRLENTWIIDGTSLQV